MDRASVCGAALSFDRPFSVASPYCTILTRELSRNVVVTVAQVVAPFGRPPHSGHGAEGRNHPPMGHTCGAARAGGDVRAWGGATVDAVETESRDARSEPVVLDEEFAEGLTSWGPKGASALALLRDAARLPTDGGVLERPDVAAPACCRAALEILTKLSGTETEGLEAARTGLEKAVAKFLAARDTSADSAVSTSAPPSDDLRDLEAAFARLCAERAMPGGYHDRKVLLLVEKTARMAPGAAERAAVRVWSKLYSDASAVVHGGSCTHADAVRMFDESVAAIRQVFVALPHRAPRIRALARSEEPTAEQAAEAAGWTDPRTRLYFLRVATSPRWLELFDAHPGFPTPDREAWPALGFLHRMRETHPDEVARWLDAHFDAVRAPGAWATLRAIALARGAAGLRGRVLEAIDGPEGAEVAREAGSGPWIFRVPRATAIGCRWSSGCWTGCPTPRPGNGRPDACSTRSWNWPSTPTPTASPPHRPWAASCEWCARGCRVGPSATTPRTRGRHWRSSPTSRRPPPTALARARRHASCWRWPPWTRRQACP
ncbi:hypothetical protein OG948_36235 (plasmid) [Embleya sp. NBC_00888]|uniref:hypothetical protein n=1 Tax=Embleya sp. NBC_00888 TaxID=2975960 RepID=UPI002F908632|nr:hypothetical protein OG948_36235 [Embleya sp. NBC_00888]